METGRADKPSLSDAALASGKGSALANAASDSVWHHAVGADSYMCRPRWLPRSKDWPPFTDAGTLPGAPLLGLLQVAQQGPGDALGNRAPSAG